MAEPGLENGLAYDSPLFDSKLLESIDWSKRSAQFKYDVSPCCPGDGLRLRPLNSGDCDRGYLQLLSQLTKVGDVSKEKFSETFMEMQRHSGVYYVIVLERVDLNCIIGTCSLIMERKFIHNCGLRGRIEDVVVNEDYRGKQLGKLLVQTATLLGHQLGVYKMSLESKDENSPFYENFGYVKDKGNNFMVLRYRERD